VPLKFGSRIFAPRPFTTILTIVLLVLLVSLGRWQLRRADERRAEFDAFDKGADATRRIDEKTAALPRYQHVQAMGSYDATRQVLIDNMSDLNGHAGYYVLTPFALEGGGWILVNRGWVPLGASRAELPAIEIAGIQRSVRGRADHLPAPGIQMGSPTALHPPFPVVANFPTRAEIAALLSESAWSGAADVVLLDADQPDGYVRQWQPPGFPPVRNIAYAVQWFGLALALFIIYCVTNFRRVTARNTTV
jgi:surfeit locus 1 family protein